MGLRLLDLLRGELFIHRQTTCNMLSLLCHFSVYLIITVLSVRFFAPAMMLILKFIKYIDAVCSMTLQLTVVATYAMLTLNLYNGQ